MILGERARLRLFERGDLPRSAQRLWAPKRVRASRSVSRRSNSLIRVYTSSYSTGTA